MICPQCKAEIRSGAKFCAKCGSRIPCCPSCGKVLTNRMRFCQNDGTMIPEEILKLIPVDSGISADDNASAAVSPDIPAEHQVPEQNVCIQCGKRCEEGQTLCAACSARQGPKKQKHKMGYCLGIAAMILLLAVGGAAGFLIRGMLPELSSATELNSLEATPDTHTVRTETTEETPLMQTEEPTQTIATTPATDATESVIETQSPPTTSATEEAPALSGEEALQFFIENCDEQYFTEADIAGFDDDMCMYARNAVYAKSGRKFKDQEIQRYFEQYEWYIGKIDPADFDDLSMLNEYQIANRNLIIGYEQEHGY